MSVAIDPGRVPQAWQAPASTACPTPADSSRDFLAAGRALLNTERRPLALACFEQALERALAEKDRRLEADARFAVAQSAYEQTQYDLANKQAEAAGTLYAELGEALLAARATRLRGSIALGRGSRAEGRVLYEAALAKFTELNADRERATVLIDLAHATSDRDEDERFLTEAIALAKRAGDIDVEARARHVRSDGLFSAGRFDEAIDELTAAIAGFEKAGSRRNLADAYVSLGRILRAHGRAADAIPHYDRAVEILLAMKDSRGVIQSLNAKAIALENLGRLDEAKATFERALAIALETKTPRFIAFIQGNMASTLNAAKDYRGAIRLLEDTLKIETDPYLLAYRHASLATNYDELKEHEQALRHAQQAIDYSTKSNNREHLVVVLWRAAKIARSLERRDLALDFARRGVEAVEQLRARLVPLDFMKRGFSESRQGIFALTLALHVEGGQSEQALVTSEQARARAFLDLLASREVVPPERPSPTPLLAATRDRAALASYAAAEAANADEIRTTAARLKSTILSYWVSPDETFIFVVSPGGAINGVRLAVGRAELEKLAAASLPAVSATGADARRKLHELLVNPVRAWLPAPQQALMIVPHGPLFRVSFATLQDSAGSYLLERYAIAYTPSVSVLRHTQQRLARASTTSKTLIVADPSPMPQDSLAALPGSRREARAIIEVVGSGSGTILMGAKASEPAIKRAATEAAVLHLATHGVIRDDEPLDSFLAVARESASEAQDGRLTVRELYDLPLTARLVVLSACRTATGAVSGDGIAGLSRAFFYAGTPAVVATLWDVADAPSARLMADFYRHRRAGLQTRDALRRAQLTLLRDLRRGTVRVPAGRGVVVLDDNPLYWGGYVLMGEPQ